MDREHVEHAMRQTAGRGITPLPAFGAGMVDGHGHTRVAFVPKPAPTPKEAASSILKDLSSRVIEL